MSDVVAPPADGDGSMTSVPGLLGQTVVILGSTDVGLATARRAKAEGAQLVITDRRSGRLDDVADELGVEATVILDESDAERLEEFLGRFPGHVDHIMVRTDAPYAPLSELDLPATRAAVHQLLLPVRIARYAQLRMRDGGSLVFAGPGRVPPAAGQVVAAIAAAALPALIASLAFEIAPVRINLIAGGGSGTRPDDVAAVAVRLMIDVTVTGVTVDAGPAVTPEGPRADGAGS